MKLSTTIIFKTRMKLKYFKYKMVPSFLKLPVYTTVEANESFYITNKSVYLKNTKFVKMVIGKLNLNSGQA